VTAAGIWDRLDPVISRGRDYRWPIILAILVAAATVGNIVSMGNAPPPNAAAVSTTLRLDAAATIITPSAVPTDREVSMMGASVPVRLAIPSIGVDTALMKLGILPDGTLEVPPDGTLAGWFTGASTPGERGAAVIAGHVDWHGPGVFHALASVVPGDRIEVTREDGSVAVFGVTEVGQFPKDAFPTDVVYADLAYAGLRLITCGGVFNKDTGHYDDNIVVFATLISSRPPAT
jgi:sortase (surface protein transpeptidase)